LPLILATWARYRSCRGNSVARPAFSFHPSEKLVLRIVGFCKPKQKSLGSRNFPATFSLVFIYPIVLLMWSAVLQELEHAPCRTSPIPRRYVKHPCRTYEFTHQSRLRMENSRTLYWIVGMPGFSAGRAPRTYHQWTIGTTNIRSRRPHGFILGLPRRISKVSSTRQW